MDFYFILEPAVWIPLTVAVVASLLALWARFIPVKATASDPKPKSEPETEAESEMTTAPMTETESESEAETAMETEAESEIEMAMGTESESEADTITEVESVSESAFDTVTVERSEPTIPKLSVIVYSFTEFDELKKYLEMAMNQDYPDYEVILVNEGSAETTASLSERLHQVYDEKLYVTFIPHDAHNLSRRKLAYTVGIKAAKGDVVLTTASNCRIPSQSWLSDMMRPFIENRAIEIVLGYSHADYAEMHGPLKWYRQMDATLTACQWIGAARLGSPYRGDCFNLAYKKDLFFSRKGYSNTIHLVNGDDDLFLSPVISGENTAVALSHDSILTTEWDEASGHILADTKERYLFTSQFLPQFPFIRAGIGGWMQWISLIAAVVASLCALPSYLGIAVAAVIILTLWIIEIAIYSRAARRLESDGYNWLLPLFLLWHPFGNMIFKSRRRSQHRKNYTFA